jgi:hypothetical protein
MTFPPYDFCLLRQFPLSRSLLLSAGHGEGPRTGVVSMRGESNVTIVNNFDPFGG